MTDHEYYCQACDFTTQSAHLAAQHHSNEGHITARRHVGGRRQFELEVYAAVDQLNEAVRRAIDAGYRCTISHSDGVAFGHPPRAYPQVRVNCDPITE